jgi:hypothetical protein
MLFYYLWDQGKDFIDVEKELKRNVETFVQNSLAVDN